MHPMRKTFCCDGPRQDYTRPVPDVAGAGPGRNSEIIDRYVVSKTNQKVRIPCDGPLTAQIERAKLEEEMKAAGREPDVEIEYLKKPRQLARAKAGLLKNAQQNFQL